MANNVEQSKKWIGDGSEGTLDVKSSGISSSEITLASATQCTSFNARLDITCDAREANSYYEIKVTNMTKGSSLAVGLVTADEFQPGWKTYGYFYNGNITNGTAALIIGFGKFMKTEDEMGVYHTRSIRRKRNKPFALVQSSTEFLHVGKNVAHLFFWVHTP